MPHLSAQWSQFKDFLFTPSILEEKRVLLFKETCARIEKARQSEAEVDLIDSVE